ncbi:phosphotransferase family protein [Parasphingopyxis lamellibrachiae]|uniref:Phosphotransferase family enzyme n=1 Tax=Parasphingopyxis lamellibrachiae TaxID=680125 RepID=A0A3D9FHT9_9SPHN|nr:aminoglycoside phosphotransferase family protein [Parasphingopyxis lamellibrachiae]RED17349.1 phosphotransferase family enzyme [Parasphingopyxis lamellibrachiae]
MVDENRITRCLIEQGLAAEGEAVTFEPCGGGVSCDVFKVALKGGAVCVKQALPQLRVAADWRVSPDRSHVEAMWLREAGRLGVPAPTVLFEEPENHFFVMTFFPEETHHVWKARLAQGHADPDFAAAVGKVLALMHNGTANSREIATDFDNGALFEALRIDPFILHCARRHPDHADRLVTLAERTRGERRALVHGDFSPKNILCGPEGPVILDAECATYGDPAFDLAFCATHLLLKSLWQFQAFDALTMDAAVFVSSYLEARADVDVATAEATARHAVDLMAALMLARVDGKSPVEYLDQAAQAKARRTALAWLGTPPESPDALIADWKQRKDEE